MPWFLDPNVYSKLPFYMNTETWLAALKLLAAFLFARALWRRGVRGARLAGSVWVFLFGIFLTVMLSMHALVIVLLRVLNRPAGSAVFYDFRLYSLVLMAVVLVAQGIRLVRAAPRLADGVHGAAREAVRATATVIVVAAPLIPLQFFGVLLTAGSLLTLAAVAAAARTPSRSRAPAASRPVASAAVLAG
ncbi:MAG TPA: hypothetical protein VF665_00095 [Longimicrobium sp.]|uniref:hypothetical protein n=1 Tax=Longimicrobium sp. TaxID=2029185 RepID=UPI002ED93842